MKAVERGEVDKVAAVLNKKGIIPTKLDVEGRSAWVTYTHMSSDVPGNWTLNRQKIKCSISSTVFLLVYSWALL